MNRLKYLAIICKADGTRAYKIINAEDFGYNKKI
jgi:hypothetical protein